jgi:biopolymer transport protein ExbB/TolQ
VQETMDIVKIQSEIYESYLNSSFGIVRYLAWSIPSIGFIGTVLGISGALAKVDEAVAGNIESVTAMLGTAFDTTLIALALSILLMFQIHRTQQLEETFIVNVQDYILKNFVNRIYIPKVK